MAEKITDYTPKSQDFIDTDLFDVSKHVTQTSGVLVVGKRYTILDYQGDDFTNVASVVSGTINTTGCVFDAIGTTPTDYTNGSTLARYETQSYTYEDLRNSLVTSYEKSGIITSAQVNSSDSFDVELIPAQGANKLIIITGLSLVRKAGTAYTTAGELRLRFFSPPIDIMILANNTALIDTALNIYTNNTYSNQNYPPLAVNDGVSFYCSAAISGGTGDLKYTIYYDVIDVS